MRVRHRPPYLKLFIKQVDIAQTLGNQLEQVVFGLLQLPRDLAERQYAVSSSVTQKTSSTSLTFLKTPSKAPIDAVFRPPVMSTKS